MNSPDIQLLERFIAENDELFELEERIGRFNAFDALGIARAEIRHSNFLAWLLAPSESHSQGDLYLKPLLIDLVRVAREAGATPPVSAVELDGVDLLGVEVHREWMHIDLLISCERPRFVVAIENKVDSVERPGQLERYEQVIHREFPGVRCLFVYLTPDGDDPSDKDWVPYSYARLHRTMLRTHHANATSVGGDVRVFVEHYLSLIGNRFMDSPELDSLCRQIYNNHRRALELIWERIGSPKSGLVGKIEELILSPASPFAHVKTKTKEVEFVLKSWDDLLPSIGSRVTFDPKRWITFRLIVDEDRVRLMCVVQPTHSRELRRRLIDRLVRDKAEFGFAVSSKSKGMTSEWTRILSEDVCPLSGDDESDWEQAMPVIEARMRVLADQAGRVPAALASFFTA